MKPHSKLRLSIPLCHLIPLPLVGPIFKVDVQLLENEFVDDYREVDRMLYVPSYDKDGKSNDINVSNTLGEHRKLCNDSFKELLQNDKDYERLGQDSSFGCNEVCHYPKNWI